MPETAQQRLERKVDALIVQVGALREAVAELLALTSDTQAVAINATVPEA